MNASLFRCGIVYGVFGFTTPFAFSPFWLLAGFHISDPLELPPYIRTTRTFGYRIEVVFSWRSPSGLSVRGRATFDELNRTRNPPNVDFCPRRGKTNGLGRVGSPRPRQDALSFRSVFYIYPGFAVSGVWRPWPDFDARCVMGFARCGSGHARRLAGWDGWEEGDVPQATPATQQATSTQSKVQQACDIYLTQTHDNLQISFVYW